MKTLPMKTIFYVLLATGTLFWSACNFSAGTNKDLSTGLSYEYNGFWVDDVLLVADNAVKTNNEVPINSSVAIITQGLSSYTLKDDLAFPGLMFRVTDKDGTAILEYEDLFAESKGYSAEDASALSGTVTVGDPMVVGETYTVKMRVWDKNSENVLTAEVDIVVTE